MKKLVGFLIKTDNTAEWVVADSPRELAKAGGFGFIERINTPITRAHNLVAVGEDDARGLTENLMGTLLSGYPQRLHGPILLCSEAMVDDPEDPGIDFVTISAAGVEFIQRIAKSWERDGMFAFAWPNMNPPVFAEDGSTVQGPVSNTNYQQPETD